MKKGKIKKEDVKITLVGDIAGKTSFLYRYTEDYFNESAAVITIGVNNFQKNLKLFNGSNIKIFFYDIGAQEKLQNIALQYVRKSHGVIIMYNIANYFSFQKALYWIAEIKDYKEDIPIIIIGNMCDKENGDRRIIKEEEEKLAQKYNFHFYESSSKLGINIEEPN